MEPGFRWRLISYGRQLWVNPFFVFLSVVNVSIFVAFLKKYGPALTVGLLVTALLVTARSMARFDILLFDRLGPGLGWVQIAGAAALGFWLTGKYLDPKSAPRWRRRTWLLFSGVFFGQLLLGLTVSPMFLMTGKLHFPIPMVIEGGAIYRAEWAFMPILFLSTILLSGPAWCSQLCYMGGCDLNRARAGRDFRSFSGAIRHRWRFRLGAVTLVATVAVLLRLLGAPLWLVTALVVLWGVTGWLLVLFLSPRKRQMIHCNLFCPMGAIVSLLKWVNPARLRCNRERCTRCMRCARACPHAAISPKDLELGRPALNCTLCGDCHAVCPHGAVEYRFLGLAPSRARTVYLTIVLTLYVTFLMLARI